MKPVLLWISEWPLRGYGAFVGACLVVGMSLVMRYGRRIGLPAQGLLDAAFGAVIGGIVGSRLLYVLVHSSDFIEAPLSALRVWEGGMMYFGGLLSGMIVGSVIAVRRGVNLWAGLDTIAPAMGASQAIGRVACLIAGCCYGAEIESAWAVTFPHEELSSIPPLQQGAPLLPIQILQIGEGIFLWWLGVWAFKRRKWDGQAFLLIMGVAGLTRFVLEGLRDDDARGFFMQETFGKTLSTSRVLGLAMIAAAILAFVVRNARQAAPRGDLPPPVVDALSQAGPEQA